MNVDDLVRIRMQPSNQHVYLVDEVGFITEIEGDSCNIHTLHLDGRSAGMGTVPLACLTAETRSEWQSAYVRYRANFEALSVQMREYSKRYDALVRKLAAQHGISTDAVLAIHNALDAFDGEAQ